MQPIDYLLIAAIAAAVFFAVRAVVKNRGACSGDCASCRRNCERREQKDRDP